MSGLHPPLHPELGRVPYNTPRHVSAFSSEGGRAAAQKQEAAGCDCKRAKCNCVTFLGACVNSPVDTVSRLPLSGETRENHRQESHFCRSALKRESESGLEDR